MSKYLALVSFFLVSFCGNLSAQSLQLINPGSNPASVVKMGNAVEFSLELLNGSNSAIAGSELEVNAPEGWVLVSAIPSFKVGSLSADKRTARVAVANVAANAKFAITLQIQPQCEAQPEVGRLSYKWYKTDVLLAEKDTPPIGNFYDPIAKLTVPVEQYVSLGNVATRIFTLEQTAVGSYINHLHIQAACNTANFDISKLEVVSTATGGAVLADITSAITKEASYYVYSLNSNTFSKVGNGDAKLDVGEKVYLRETFTLKKCDQGLLNYSTAYGNSTSYCSYSEPVSAVASVYNPGYSVDIQTVKGENVYIANGATKGAFTFKVSNNSVDASASMYNLLVAVYNSDLRHFIYTRAYFSDASGNPIAGLPDIPLINNRAPSSHAMKWFVSFDRLPSVAGNSTEAAKYAARGLCDADGDGIYDDLAKGKEVIFTVEYTMQFFNAPESASLQSSSTRKGDLYYQNTCGDYISFTRNYWSPGSTNYWVGEFKYPSPVVTLSKINVAVGEQLNMLVRERAEGNGNAGFCTTSIDGTNEHRVNIKLPKGFEYNSAGGIKINGTAVTAANIQVVSAKEVIFRNIVSAAMGQTYTIAIKAINEPVDMRSMDIKHTFKSALNSATYEYAKYTVPLTYEIVGACNRLELTNFSAERTTFGWTNSSMTAKASKAGGANVKVAGPYDNVSMQGAVAVKSAVVLTSGEKLLAKLSYIGASGSSNYYFGTGQGAKIKYKKSGSSTFVDVASIPAASITQAYSNATREHSLMVDITSYVGAGKPIVALGAGDNITIEFLTQTTGKLPRYISYVEMLGMQVYTEKSGVINGCNSLVNEFRVVDYGLNYLNSGNNGSAYSVNATKQASILHYWLNTSSGSPGTYFPNEFRPNTRVSSLKMSLGSLVKVNQLLNNAGAVPASAYSVTYSGGSTIIAFTSPLAEETFFNQWSGYNLTLNWDAICWSSQGTTLSFTANHYPTSENPQVENLNVTSGLDLTVTDYAFDLTSASPACTPIDKNLEWELAVTNKSQWANADGVLPNSWIAVELPSGVTPVSLIDKSSGTAVAGMASYSSGRYWWKLGDIDVKTNKTYTLKCIYSSCTTPTVKAKFSSSKGAYPTNPDVGFTQYNSGMCGAVPSVNLTFNPPSISFSGSLVEKGRNGNGNFTFCDPITFEAKFINGLATKVYNMVARVKLPEGMEWVGDAKVKQGAGAYAAIPAGNITVSGGIATIKLGSSIELNSNGADKSDATLEFKLKTTCGFTSGINVYTDLVGESACGASIATSVNSGGITIEGISGQVPSYVFESVNTTPNTPTLSAGSNGKFTLSGSIKLISANASPNDFIFIEIPENLQLTSTGTVPKLAFTQSGNLLVAPLPATGIFGTVSSFSIELTPQNPVAWDCKSYDITLSYGVKKELACAGVPGNKCEIKEFGGNTEVASFTIKKYQVAIGNDLAVVGKYKNATTETITASGKLVNGGSVNAENVNVYLYLDNNNNGVFDAGDTPATGNPSVVVPIVVAGEDASFSITADIPTSEVCKLMAVVVKNAANPYLCSSHSVKPATYGYVFESIPTVCHGVGVQIGTSAITGYTYSWDTEFTTNSTQSNPTFTYPLSKEVTAPYVDVDVPVTITRVGGCTVSTMQTVRVNRLPEVSISSVSGNEGTNLQFRLTLAGDRCSNDPVSVKCKTADHSSLNPATGGADYVVKEEVVTFAPAATEAFFTVILNSDNLVEGDETFEVQLSLPVSCRIVGATAVGTIKDMTDGTIIVEKQSDGSEPGTDAVFRIRFKNSSVSAAYNTVVSYELEGTAPGVSSYTIKNGCESPIRLPLGSSYVDVVLKVNNNYTVEGSKPVQLVLKNVQKE